jgi:hypothetical protein
LSTPRNQFFEHQVLVDSVARLLRDEINAEEQFMQRFHELHRLQPNT